MGLKKRKESIRYCSTSHCFFAYMNTSTTNDVQILTESWNSGSLADASHRFIKIKTFGFDKRFDTVWKNDFSYKKMKQRYSIWNHWMVSKIVKHPKINLTAKVIVDSAFRTNTNTSASKQWLSIQSSKFGDTSTPGESTNTTSSRNRLHRSRGQKIRIFELSHNFSEQRAFANWFTFWKEDSI